MNEHEIEALVAKFYGKAPGLSDERLDEILMTATQPYAVALGRNPWFRAFGLAAGLACMLLGGLSGMQQAAPGTSEHEAAAMGLEAMFSGLDEGAVL